MARNDRTPRRQRQIDKKTAKEQKKHNIDSDQALCTECGQWYDSSKRSEFLKHSH